MTPATKIDLELTEIELDHVADEDLERVVGGLPAGHMSIKFPPEYTKLEFKSGSTIAAN